MTTKHPQEKIIKAFDYNGIAVDLVEWTDTVWCGKIGYASNNTDEPDVDKIMSGFQTLNVPSATANEREDGWDTCISLNYLSKERPNGSDTSPIFEYYGYYNSDKRAHEFCYLYVPVEKA